MERPWLRHYEAHVPRSISIPDLTIGEVFARAVRDFPRATALIYFGRRMSYRRLGKSVERCAAGLAHLGVKKGDRVAIVLPNIPQYPIVHYAVMQLGAIAVPTNPLYVERELEYQLRDSGAQVAVTLDLLFTRLEAVRGRTALREVIYTGVGEYLPALKRLLYPIKARREGRWVKIRQQAHTHAFSTLIKKSLPRPPEVEIGPEEVAIFLYTGGTTGISKGAVLSHRNLVANLVQVRSWFSGIRLGKEVTLAVLPFFHSYGMTSCLQMSPYIGGANVLIPRFDLDLVLKSLANYKVTLFPGVPTMYVAVNNNPNTSRYDLKKIRACISGGAALPLQVSKKFEETAQGARLVEGYGLSETSPVTHCNPIAGERREGSIGLPVPGTDAIILDPETHEPLPPHQIGELAVQGPQVMQGYWNMEEETRQVMHNGWFLTGDLAKMDEDGYFYIVDRKKDMIIAGGFNIYPREIEEILYNNPKVKEVAVIGACDPYRGETVKAFIVLKEDQQASEEEMIAYCQQYLAKYKAPKLVEFRQALPKSMIGKVLRRVLVEEERNKQKQASKV
ncbi:MAG: long-chain-fatty-acid--CoA ligase [bacterium]